MVKKVHKKPRLEGGDEQHQTDESNRGGKSNRNLLDDRRLRVQGDGSDLNRGRDAPGRKEHFVMGAGPELAAENIGKMSGDRGVGTLDIGENLQPGLAIINGTHDAIFRVGLVLANLETEDMGHKAQLFAGGTSKQISGGGGRDGLLGLIHTVCFCLFCFCH